MAFADWIPTIINVGSSLFGGGGSSAPSAPSSSGLDWGSILQGVGQLASRVEMVPGAGALDEDIRKANRFNLLAGLLGGGAQLAGGQMQAAEKAGMLKDVSDILSGKQTTTGQAIEPAFAGTSATPMPQSVAISQLMGKYPRQGQALLDLSSKLAEQEQGLLKEQFRAATKTGIRPLDFPTAVQLVKNLGVPTENLAQAANQAILENEQSRQEQIQGNLQQLGLMGEVRQAGSNALQGLIPSQQPTKQMAQTPQMPAQRQTDGIETTTEQYPFPKMTEVEKQTAESFLARTEPTPEAKKTLDQFIQVGEERRKQTEQRQQEFEKQKLFKSVRKDFAAPYAEVLRDASSAEKDFLKIKSNLEQGKFYNTRQAVKQMEALIDKSVVHPVEQREAMKSLIGYFAEFKRAIASAGSPVDLPKEAKVILFKTAKAAYEINMQAGEKAEAAITAAALDYVKNNNLNASPAMYLKQFTRGKDLLSQFEQENQQQVSPMVNPAQLPAPSVATPKVYRPGMITQFKQ